MPQRGLKSPSYQASKRQNRVNIPGYRETLWNPLYDYQTLAAAGAASQLFFQEPIGASSKTLADTNMELSGQIPKGQAFTITGVQFDIFPGILPSTEGTGVGTASEYINDVLSVLKAGVLILRIGSKDYIRQGPLMKFPPVNRLAGISSVAAATTVAAESMHIQTQYAVGSGREFTIDGKLLEANQNFGVELLGLAALPSTVDARIGVTLNGWLHRNSQ